MSAKPVDVLAVMDNAQALVFEPGKRGEEWALLIAQARAAVAELIAACDARDKLGRRPSFAELMEDCTGHACAEAANYDAVQERYRVALAAVKGKKP